MNAFVMRNSFSVVVGLCLLVCGGMSAQSSARLGRILFSENFNAPLDTALWHVEMDSLPGSSVTCRDASLVLDTRGGVTVWLKKPLSGNYRITYSRLVVMDGGSNDRLSDLNQFWMASDPRNPNLFTRKGKFAEYDSLRLYYVGMGGNYNETTRFRKYMGNGERLMLLENSQPDHLLKANHRYRICIEVKDGVSTFFVDGVKFFEYADPAPILSGYFGFRSTWSHHVIDDLVVYSFD